MKEIKFNNKTLEVEKLRVVIQPLSNISDSSSNIYVMNHQRFRDF